MTRRLKMFSIVMQENEIFPSIFQSVGELKEVLSFILN